MPKMQEGYGFVTFQEQESAEFILHACKLFQLNEINYTCNSSTFAKAQDITNHRQNMPMQHQPYYSIEDSRRYSSGVTGSMPWQRDMNYPDQPTRGRPINQTNAFTYTHSLPPSNDSRTRIEDYRYHQQYTGIRTNTFSDHHGSFNA